ncbi:prepilin-type N-terminal cleavage/methylation domain-containing protein [Jonesia quinghaiensis]|uniref:prepilin-type N-terminal cleavage/methylation domain-containing protein n=1 Tax=Jonesia quinghaiensis TaxID=262806 RepID=UPI00048C35A1|nr:prepilin-type N-terminal cleavage/methylation domain-containing protein [Jonesia quinghaiensis]
MIARLSKAMNEKEKGFTLIELLVVIIIIGILAAIAIPVFMNQRQKAVDSSVKSDLRTLATQIEDYWVDNQGYPATLGGDAAAGYTIDGDAVATSEGNTFVYTDNGQSYTIVGTNPNGDQAVAGITYDSAAGGLQQP